MTIFRSWIQPEAIYRNFVVALPEDGIPLWGVHTRGLGKTFQERRQVLEVQQVLCIQENLVFLEVQRVHAARGVQLVPDHQDIQVRLVFLEDLLGLVRLLAQLGLDHQGNQEGQVYLGVQQGRDHQGNQGIQPGRVGHLCLVYLAYPVHLKLHHFIYYLMVSIKNMFLRKRYRYILCIQEARPCLEHLGHREDRLFQGCHYSQVGQSVLGAQEGQALCLGHQEVRPFRELRHSQVAPLHL